MMAQRGEEGTVRLWDTVTREATTLKVGQGGMDLMVLSPDGRTLITRGRERVLRRWDLAGETNTVWAVEAFSVFTRPMDACSPRPDAATPCNFGMRRPWRQR